MIAYHILQKYYNSMNNTLTRVGNVLFQIG